MREIALILIGSGRVGNALRGHLTAFNERLGADLKFRVAATIRSRWLEFENGASEPRTSDDWASVIRMAHEMRRKEREPVIVDVSDARSAALHLSLVDSGFTVVTANKIPLTWGESFRRLTQALDGRSHRAYWFEATVGGGLPVVRALRELVETGDRVVRVSAMLSGTLNYLCDAHARRRPFGQALAGARDLGLTEPDPRDDLLCRDVIRKTQILASLCGCWWTPSDDIAPVIPADLARLFPDDFVGKMRSVVEWPEPWPRPGTPVDYVVRIEPTVSGSSTIVGGFVGRDPARRPLEGSENLFVIESERNERPIEIRGPGAGAAVTATAVFGDLLRSLARI